MAEGVRRCRSPLDFLRKMERQIEQSGYRVADIRPLAPGVEGAGRPFTPAKGHWSYRRSCYKHTPRGCDCSDRSTAEPNSRLAGEAFPRPREGGLPHPAEAQRDSVLPVFSRPSDVPEEVLSNRITARRRACMETPRGGIRERAGRRKEDGMAGDRSPGDRREGGRPLLGARAGPGGSIRSVLLLWWFSGALRAPEEEGWINFW